MKLPNKLITENAKQLGFDLVGFSRAEKLEDEIKFLEGWIKKGAHGSMEYMERNLLKKKDVREILPDASSVISLGMNYYCKDGFTGNPDNGKISRYAWGKDYHIIIGKKLRQLIDNCKESEPAFEGIGFVDSGPVMDKVWAVRSGLGWLGKHTNVINKRIGSWFFIANIITNGEFEYSEIQSDRCGTCRACIDACPTSAITGEYQLDSRLCISFLTIENKNGIDERFRDQFGSWLFGCDICQDVCPWNRKFSVPAHLAEFAPSDYSKEIDLESVIGMKEPEFNLKFAESAVKRTRLKGLKRNAEFLLKGK